MSALNCSNCGSDELYLSVGFDGLDVHSEFGEGSGYKYSVDLNCPRCGRVYVIGRVRSFNAFALDIEAKHFAYEGQNIPQSEMTTVTSLSALQKISG